MKYDTEPQNILRESPNDLICVDGHGPMVPGKYGYKHIFVAFDVFSKFIRLYPMRTLTTRGCLRKLDEDFIPLYGKMKAVLSDNASMFRSPKWREYFEGRGIQVLHSSSYHPSGNPVERQMKTISTYLRIFCHENYRGWVDYCKVIENIINNTPNPSTKISPALLFTGNEPAPILQGIPPSIATVTQEKWELCKKSLERQRKRALKRKSRVKRHRHKWNPQVGEKVLVKDRTLSSKLKQKTSKLDLLYRGPLVITRVYGNYTYELSTIKNAKRVGTYHKQLLRKYKE